MSSFIDFLNTANSTMNGVLSALGGNGGDGCTFTLKGGDYEVSFPVSPPDFEVVNPYNNSTLNIDALGDVNMLGKRGLATMRFASFFPAQAYNFVQGTSIRSPYEYVQQIRSMAQSGKPCRISITGTDVSLPCSIEEFSYKEKDGSGDVYFTLSLKEYRYITPDSEKLNSATGLKSRVAETVEEKRQTVYSVMDTMDAAAKTIQRTVSIAKQGSRTMALYKAMVKSGGVPAGTIMEVTTKGVTAGGKSLVRW